MAVLNPYNYGKPKGAITQRPATARPTSEKRSSQNNSTQYLEQKVRTASPEQLTLMLYEGAIKFTKQAKIFNAEKNIEKTSNTILRVSAIYTELRATLNSDYEISKSMDQMYEYIIHRLAQANIEKSNDILDEVLKLSEEFRDTWKEAMTKVNR